MQIHDRSEHMVEVFRESVRLGDPDRMGKCSMWLRKHGGVADREIWDVVGQVVTTSTRPGTPAELGDSPLPRREREVLAQVQHGLSNREVGLALGISEHTVKGYLQRVHRRLCEVLPEEVNSDRTNVICWCIRLGWIPL